MASSTDIARREAIILDRLTKTAARIAKRLPDIEAPDIPARHRYPDMLPLTQLSALADFLDDLDGAIKDEGYAATTGNDGDDAPDLAAMNRYELNLYAHDTAGIDDPNIYRTKSDLIAAVEAHASQKETDEMGDTTTTTTTPAPEPMPEPEPVGKDEGE